MGVHQQTKIINEAEGIRISRLCPENRIVENFFPDLKHQTLHCLFERGLKLGENGGCLGTRTKGEEQYKWKTYREVRNLSVDLGSGLMEWAGHMTNQEEKVGIYSVNRWEWDVAQIALNSFSMVSVPLYDTLGVEAISYIISVTDMKTVICDTEEKVKKLLACRNDCPNLTSIVTMEEISSEMVSKVKQADLQVITYDKLLEKGRNAANEASPPTDSDSLALILFTSGTTGRPKGVMLSNRNIVTDVGAMLEHYKMVAEPTTEDVVISYLPQAHGFNQVITQCMFAYGGKVGYLSGNVLQLLDDVRVLKPTLFPIVPRLLNKIYDSIWQRASKSSIKKLLLKKAYEAKKHQMSKGELISNDIWEKLVFRKVQKLLGGHVKGLVTGSAPVSGEVLTFVRCAVGCNVLEGYGQTETTAASTCTMAGDFTPGHVGVPLLCCEIKLADIPEMNYFSKNNQGEVCFRGPHCFMGYWKDEENTAAAIDSEGWLHSGDVGVWTERGTLRLVDRKKNIFKLAQGEYIAPEKVEGVYLQCPTVAQIFVHGDSLETCCVGIVVPDEAVLKDVASELGVEEKTMAGLCKSPKIKAHVMDEMKSKGLQMKLNKLEQVKNIYLWSQQFSIENDLLTPTLKSKRPQMRKAFETEIKRMYDEVNSQ